MHYGRNNIVVKIRGAGVYAYAILNPITGSFDLMDEREYLQLEEIRAGSRHRDDNAGFIDYLLERGYLFRSRVEEDRAIRRELVRFQREIANSQVQLLLIPTYNCNLACAYCYQEGIPGGPLVTREVVDAFFHYAEDLFSGAKVRPYITLFGGEPLINSPRQQEIIGYIVERCTGAGYELAVVTNGYDLVDYAAILSRARIKEIQVTLDGYREVHDQRRMTKGGGGTFDRIIAGLDEVIRRGMPVNLRTVVDRENMPHLVRLAEFAGEKGWLDLGLSRFKTQIGRNYELFVCYARPQYLLSQVELWREYVELSRVFPVLKKFHRPDFKGIRHLVETGKMYPASFDTCPAAKLEWVFDPHGHIYGCTASCGRKEYRLGIFYPDFRLDEQAVSRWQRRSVRTIPGCRDCRYNVICGGGCGVVAANRTGEILAPDCRPVQDLIELGVNYYLDEILALSEAAG